MLYLKNWFAEHDKLYNMNCRYLIFLVIPIKFDKIDQPELISSMVFCPMEK